MKNKKAPGKGGKREGAGAKHKYGEPTKMMRVPISLIPALEKKMLSLANKALKQGNK